MNTEIWSEKVVWAVRAQWEILEYFYTKFEFFITFIQSITKSCSCEHAHARTDISTDAHTDTHGLSQHPWGTRPVG